MLPMAGAHRQSGFMNALSTMMEPDQEARDRRRRREVEYRRQLREQIREKELQKAEREAQRQREKQAEYDEWLRQHRQYQIDHPLRRPAPKHNDSEGVRQHISPKRAAGDEDAPWAERSAGSAATAAPRGSAAAPAGAAGTLVEGFDIPGLTDGADPVEAAAPEVVPVWRGR